MNDTNPNNSVDEYINELAVQPRPTAYGLARHGGNKPVGQLDNYEPLQISLQPVSPKSDNVGVIMRLRQRRLRNGKELEAARIVFEAHIEKLKYQASAAQRESKAYWDARSVEVAETIKTYVQQTLRALEVERFDTQSEATIEASKRATAKMEQIANSTMPESVKKNLICQITQNLEATVERILTNAIAAKFDLV